MENLTQLQQALRDVEEVRRAIETPQGGGQRIGMAGLQASYAIHLTALVGLLILVNLELVASPSLTTFLWSTADTRLAILRVAAVFLIFLSLVVLALLVYFIVWRTARRTNEDLSRFIGRNFRYLSLASLSSDLFLKFSAVALVILAQRPDWVSPVLIACTGDYLVQGRIFVLPPKLGVVLGFLFLVLSILSLVYAEGHLYEAILLFSIPLFLSFTNIRRLLKKGREE